MCVQTDIIHCSDFTFELELKEKQEIKKEGKICTRYKIAHTPTYIQQYSQQVFLPCNIELHKHEKAIVFYLENDINYNSY